jgi:alkylation response protein AidB-like acyl-CoA dehydrogenase
VHAVADTAWDLLGAGLLDLPLPGAGATIMRWWALVEIAAVDLSVAHLVERHLEAQAIHAEAGRALPDGLWSVWSDDSPDSRLRAKPTEAGWVLSGTKRGCSGARSITTALVTARDDEGTRLFALPTRDPAIRFDPDSWPAVGLALTDTLHMTVDSLEVPAGALIGGEPNWYSERPGSWAVGAGSAAVWYGGALGLARSMRTVVSDRATDAFGLVHLGFVDAACSAMEAMLQRAARALDSGDASAARTAAWQVRAVVEHLATAVQRESGQALGGDLMAHDATIARRVADRTAVLRQHTADREYAALGGDVLDSGRLT